MGLDFIDTPYGKGIGHSGSDIGAQSRVRRFPDLDATVVLLVNAGDSGDMGTLTNDLWNDAMTLALTGL